MWACEVDPRETGRCGECTTTPGRHEIAHPLTRRDPSLGLPMGSWPGDLSTGGPGAAYRPQIRPGWPAGPNRAGTVCAMPSPPRACSALVARLRGLRPRAAPTPRMLIALLALLIVISRAPAATGSSAAQNTWSWPLDGSPSVVRGFEPPPEPWLAGHRGVDLLAAPGELVRAASGGRVTFAGPVGGVPAVAVTHPDGLRTTYEPVLAAVGRGADVARDTVLGRVSAGGSHCLPLACLHWGLRRGGSYLDPLSLVGADIEVRLLPVWSDMRPPPQPGAASTARPDLARVGALNRARAAPWESW
jgi:murein DD-endopeptidase MepM/ murein hydrolase activator NlpD